MIHSPLTLLDEWHNRADGAPLREFLLTGFTLDLPFLERVAVPMARALGAAVTLVGDASQNRNDPMNVRRAGRDYTYALASCGGWAFHPKLALLLGDHEVVAAIGSGNPTLSGWGHNDELWTVLRGGPDGMPWELADLVTWLKGCARADKVGMPTYMRGRLVEVADQLEELLLAAEPVEGGGRVLHNLDQSLIDQLPEGPVDELCLYAPFIDPGAHALRNLLDRFSPRRVVLGVQEFSGSYDGDALERVLAGTGAELRLLEESAPRHGKLVEWVLGERRWALTGSANLTGAALSRSTNRGGQGGNCELGTVVELGSSLMPAATAVPVSRLVGVNTVAPFARERGSDVPVPLGSILNGDTLVVTLAAAARTAVVVETSGDGSPGSWQDVGTIAAGESEGEFTTWGGGGLVVRVRLSDGRTSAVVFTIDPRACDQPTEEDHRPRMRRHYTEESLVDADAELGLQQDVLRLAREAALYEEQRPATGAKDAVESRFGTVSDRAVDRWEEYLEGCERTFGVPLTVSMFGARARVGTRTGPERWVLAGAADPEGNTSKENPRTNQDAP